MTWLRLGFTFLVGLLLVLRWRGIVTTVRGVDIALVLTLAAGFPIFHEAVQGLFAKRIVAELAVAIAAIAALGVGENLAAAVVVFIMLVGHTLEDYAAGRARRSIRTLMEGTPPTATVRRDGREQRVPVTEVRVGDTVIVRPGERLPVDGVVLGGVSGVTQAYLTGEPLPVDKHPGDEVFAGTLNGEGALEVEARRVGEDTTLATVVRLVEQARLRKAPIERLADRYAAWFVPAVLLLAAATYGVTHQVLRAVTVLVVTCPCALVLATPTAVICALARLAREGILVKGGLFLELLSECDCVVFDKTGTLTRGEPVLTGVECFGEATEEEVLGAAAAAESRSEHLLARLVVQRAVDQGLAFTPAADAKTHPGQGIECTAAGRQVLVGNRSLLAAHGVVLPAPADTALTRAEERGETAVLVAVEGRTVGLLRFADTLRDEAPAAVHDLTLLGISRVLLLTGDNRAAASQTAQAVGIREFEAELLPHQKMERIRALQEGGRRVVMVGDGVNDAPALAAADVGVALGGTGIDLTLEAAAVVFMTDDLRKLPRALDVSRRTVALIKENLIVFALGVNAAAILAAAAGRISPIAGAVIHEGSSLLVVLNSMRLLLSGTLPAGRLGRAVTSVRVAGERLAALPEVWNKRRFRALWTTVREPVLRWGRVVVPVGVAAALSVYTVGPDRVGVVRRFGRVVAENVQPGLHVRWPYPVERVTKVTLHRVRAAEIGYRTRTLPPGTAPVTYEWSTQHRRGRYKRLLVESIMFSGDETLVEVNAVCQYAVADPVAFLFHVADPEKLVHRAAESALQETVRHTALVDILSTGRRDVERRSAKRLAALLAKYHAGIEVHGFHLQDVHPPVEVVDAYREVSSAMEEKETLINQAEAYRNEQIPLAEGKAAQELMAAAGYALDRVNRAAGDADRFNRFEAAYRLHPDVTAVRLHLETIDETLAGLPKLIIDHSGTARRQLYLLDARGLRVDVPGLDKLSPPSTGTPFGPPGE